MTNPERRGGPALPGGFWGDLPEPEREVLRRLGTLRTFAKGAALCHEGDRSEFVVVILAGFVKVYTTARDGHQAMLGVRGNGDLVLESGAYPGIPRSATVEALDQVRALVIPGERFRAVLDDHPAISAALGKVSLIRRQESDQRFVMGVEGEQRLARLLLTLSGRFGVRGAGGQIRIDLPLSQTELASWIGKSREMVARAYRSWREAKIVRTGRRTITIIDVAELRRIADDEEAR